jgi:alpha-ketoglutaric semialdehyde dehydrogenase
MEILGKNCIGYEFSSESKDFFYTYNPNSNTSNEFKIFETSENEIIRAVSKAKNAFLIYRNLNGKVRAGFLLKIASKLEIHRNILIQYYQLETALPIDRANNELNRTIFQLQHFSEFISNENWNFCSKDDRNEHRKPNPKPKLEKRLIPLGPVVVFGASNFPFAYSTIGGDTVSALAAGCPVIVKSHFMHAGTADLVAQLVNEAAFETNMPDGIFSNLNSRGIELGQKLVLNTDIKAVGFTGSQKAGLALQKLIQSREEVIPFFAEMGSVNPIFITETGYEIKNLVAILANSITLNAGQFCTNPGLIFLIKNDNTDSFIEQLQKKLNENLGQRMIHPNLQDNFVKAATFQALNLKKVVEIDVNSTEMKPILQVTDFKMYNESVNFQQEVFGMHTILVVCNSIEEFDNVIENLEGQLTASIFCMEKKYEIAIKLSENLKYKVGRIILNGVPTGVEVSSSMHHGGPFPATTDSRFTAVGKDAIYRFLRPVAFQNFPNDIKI